MSVLVWLPVNSWHDRADVGARVGTAEGTGEGAVGCVVGCADGSPDATVGPAVGSVLGAADGLAVVGRKVGMAVGTGLGAAVGVAAPTTTTGASSTTITMTAHCSNKRRDRRAATMLGGLARPSKRKVVRALETLCLCRITPRGFTKSGKISRDAGKAELNF